MADDFRGMLDADRIIHEPARLIIVAILYAVKSADFLYLLRETGLTKGNLSSHLGKLEDANYIEVEKIFQGKVPRTLCSLTAEGRAAFVDYRKKLENALKSMPREE